MSGHTNPGGLTRIDILAIIALGAMGSFVLSQALVHVMADESRVRCGDNLSAIGKAMLMYANDHSGLMPVAGGRDTRWGAALPNWTSVSRQDAFGLDPNGMGGEATIGSSLYLLIRYGYGDVTCRTFLCSGDKGVKQFDPVHYGLKGKELAGLWDFGPNPARHCSYAYQMVYGRSWLTRRSESWAFAMAADRNPWMDEKRAKNFPEFQPDYRPFAGTAKQGRFGSAVAHGGEGQNVLFLDTHVDFEKRPFCGLDEDNIYTSWNADDKARGTPPKLGSVPADVKDSLLVNDPVQPGK